MKVLVACGVFLVLLAVVGLGNNRSDEEDRWYDEGYSYGESAAESSDLDPETLCAGVARGLTINPVGEQAKWMRTGCRDGAEDAAR